jgi:hypothetical protein
MSAKLLGRRVDDKYTYTRPCVGSAAEEKEKPVRKSGPWKVSATLYVAARAPPARRMERATVEEEMNFIAKTVEKIVSRRGHLAKS